MTLKAASFSNGMAAGAEAARRPLLNNPAARNTAAAAGEIRNFMGSPVSWWWIPAGVLRSCGG
uniref:Uncharacterized protein n=1 Tax=uncultured bacterium pAB2 TaxID=1448270 RepID=W5VJP3_9BACT|nr:hypothetical protein [uncultured bacterium pAB2]